MTTLVELAYHNALAFQELEFGLINARLAHGLTPEQVEERIFSDRKIDFPTLRAYALAVGAKVTITVETVEVEKRAQLVDEWMQVTGLSTKETRDLISKIEEGLEK